jgi:uncharacterized membrane protein YidH (DUF202 family)
LKHLGAGYHDEALAGDLIEQYAQGRTRLWYWQQIVIAIWFARARPFQTRTWIALRRVLYRVAIELAIVLGAVAAIDQSRRSQDSTEMFSPPFLATMAFLVAVALVGLILLRRTRKADGQRALVDHLIVLFAIAALGAGTLTWADTARRQVCSADNCLCQKTERPSTR